MKIIVERDAFAEALGSVKHVTDKGIKIPILSNVLLRANGALLEIAATNIDMRGECRVAAEIARDAKDVNEITVPVTILSDLTNQTRKGAQLTLEWDIHGKHVTLISGRSRHKLNALPGSDYPVLPPPDDPVTFSISGKLFAEAIKTVKWSMYGAVDRPWFCGIFLHITDDDHALLGSLKARRLALVATDGANLARFSLEPPRDLKALPHLIIPDAAIGEIASIAADAADEIEIAVSRSKLSVTSGNHTFLTKVVDGTFPEGYTRTFPDDPECRMLAEVDALRGALLRLSALERGKRARAHWSDGLLTLSMNSDKGEGEEQVEIEYEGPPTQLPVSTTALIAALDQCPTDTCLFRFKKDTTSKPIIINPMISGSIDYSRTFLTMPMDR